MFSQKTPIVHLQIDVQEHFLNRLKSARKTFLPAYLEEKSARLLTFGIPTIQVAYRTSSTPQSAYWGLFANTLTRKRDPVGLLNRDVLRSLGLVNLKPSQLVYIKNEDTAFPSFMPVGTLSLERYLKRVGCRHLLFSGMNTAGCILDTVEGAYDRGIFCHVMMDCLADGQFLAKEFERGVPTRQADLWYDVWGYSRKDRVRMINCARYLQRLEIGRPRIAALMEQMETVPASLARKNIQDIPDQPSYRMRSLLNFQAAWAAVD